MAEELRSYDSNGANAGSASIITKETVGPTKAGLNVSSDELRYTQAFDYDNRTDGQPVYQGWAEPGANVGSAVWRIAKFNYDTNSFISGINWISGNRAFTNAWSTRSGTTYS